MAQHKNETTTDEEVNTEHLPDTLRAAMSVVSAGWPVISIYRESKVPTHPGGSLLGNHREFWLTSIEEVEAAYLDQPYGCQFAVMTGVPNAEGISLVAVDVDGPGLPGVLDTVGDQARRWAMSTLRVQRSEGSLRQHVVGTMAGPVPRTGLLAPGVEWRGEGGYVLLPGSLHPDGTRYAVTRPSPPLRVPDSLVALASPVVLPATVAAVALRGEPAYPRLLSALRAQGQVRVGAGSARAHCPGPTHDKGDPHPSLVVRDSGDGRVLVKCQHEPPCRTQDVVAALGLRMADLFDDTTTGMSVDVIDGPDTALALNPAVVQTRAAWVLHQRAATALADEIEGEPFAESWFGRLGSEFDQNTPEPVPTVLRFGPGPEHVAFVPGITLLFGSRSSLKTWLAYYALSQEIKAGRPGLIIDYELSYEEAMRRLLTLEVTEQEMERVVYVQPDGPISARGRAYLLSRFERTGPPTAAIQDSLTSAMGMVGMDPNDNGAVAHWLSKDVPVWMKRQWPHTVQLLIDHLPKGANGVADDPIGAQAKGAVADGMFNAVASGISRETAGDGLLYTRKARQGYHLEGQVLLKYDFGGGTSFRVTPGDSYVGINNTGDAAEKAARKIEQDAAELAEAVAVARVRLLQVLARGPSSRTKLTGSGRDGYYSRIALDQLIAEGLVVQEKAGRLLVVSLAVNVLP